MESDGPSPFTLGQFYTVWGRSVLATRLGGYADDGANRVRVSVDRHRVPDPARHVLAARERIVVAFGRPSQAPNGRPLAVPPGF